MAEVESRGLMRQSCVADEENLLFEGCSHWNKSEEERGWFVC